MPRLTDNAIIDAISRDCLVVRLRRLNREISTLYDDALRPHGLTGGQLNILTVLSRLRESDAGTIGRVLEMEKSTVSRNLDRMRRHGWVETPEGTATRPIRLRVSAAGRGLLRAAYPAWQRAQEQARALLGDDAEALFEIGDRAWQRSLDR